MFRRNGVGVHPCSPSAETNTLLLADCYCGFHIPLFLCFLNTCLSNAPSNRGCALNVLQLIYLLLCLTHLQKEELATDLLLFWIVLVAASTDLGHHRCRYRSFHLLCFQWCFLQRSFDSHLVAHHRHSLNY